MRNLIYDLRRTESLSQKLRLDHCRAMEGLSTTDCRWGIVPSQLVESIIDAHWIRPAFKAMGP